MSGKWRNAARDVWAEEEVKKGEKFKNVIEREEEKWESERLEYTLWFSHHARVRNSIEAEHSCQ